MDPLLDLLMIAIGVPLLFALGSALAIFAVSILLERWKHRR